MPMCPSRWIPIAFLFFAQGFIFGGEVFPPPPGVSDGLVEVNDYSKGLFCGTFSDKIGSKLTNTLQRTSDGRFMVCRYELVHDGNLGLWNRAGMDWNKKQDWTGFKGLRLLAYANERLDFLFILKFRGKDYSVPFVVPGKGQWDTIVIPRESFRGLPEDTDFVTDYNIVFKTPGEHSFAFSFIKLEGLQKIKDPEWEEAAFYKNIRILEERSQKTYFVALNGDDGNPGTEKEPWRTPQKAADTMLPGDTVLVRGGNYELSSPNLPTGQAGVFIYKSGAPDAWITYRAYPGEQPCFNSASWCTIRITAAAYIEVDGFEVTTSPFSVRGGFQSVGAGVGTGDAHHVVIRNIKAHDCGGGGVAACTSDYVTIENCLVWNTSAYNPYQCSGISIYQARDFDLAPGYHNIVRRCISYSNENKVPSDKGVFTDGNGIIIDDSKNIQGKGPHVASRGRFLVENNLCFANGARGIHVFFSRNVDVYNNTTYRNGQAAKLDGDRVEICAGLSENIRILNNVVMADEGKVTIKNRNSKNLVTDYNVHGAGVVEERGEHDLVADPLFVKPLMGPGFDFRLRAESAALGRAFVGDAPPVDSSGTKRESRTSVDPGAFQSK